jgi:hypothetical protein
MRPHLQQPPLVEFAIFFHDIVYDAQSKENEELSAQLFEERWARPRCRAHVPPPMPHGTSRGMLRVATWHVACHASACARAVAALALNSTAPS